MTEEMVVALGSLALIVIGALGTLVKVLVSRIQADLQANTVITQQTHDISNGRLSNVITQLATERNLVQGLRYLVRERDDRIAYITSRIPAAADLMIEYSNRLTRRSTEADELAAERHILNTEK